MRALQCREFSLAESRQDTAQVMYNTVLASLSPFRGCSFVTKALNAERFGAKAVIISDNNYEDVTQWIDMIGDGTDRQVRIPAYFMLGKDGYGRFTGFCGCLP